MPKGPKGEKRPADVIARAILVGRIATGEIEDKISTPEDEGKNPHAVALGKKGGIKGGKRRAEKLSKEERTNIAAKAARARWGKNEESES